ncbi:MAG TPA: DUF58 domain-containing protein [Burkholderiaceae bacterium]|nr:DUF58 domain-containing protein [Burkholderiaceae bacterium]
MRKLAFFRLAYRVSRWLRERLTANGLVLGALTALAGTFGLDTQANLAHMLFSIGTCFLVVDALGVTLLRFQAPRLKARRHLPNFVTVGESAKYRIEIWNPGSKPAKTCDLAEELGQPWPSAEALAGFRNAVVTNRFDRRVGYPAFVDMLRRLRAVEIGRANVPRLLPGQKTLVDLAVAPIARGLANCQRLCVVLTGPLGLVELRVPVAVEQGKLPVLPERTPVELPPVATHRLLQPGGIVLAQHVGDSEEFRSLRDYRPGDPLRSIHWRSFARMGKPIVREFQEEFFSRQALVLDTSAPYPFAPSFEKAVSMAAWLIARRRDAESLLDLVFVGDRVHRLTVGRSLGSNDLLLRVLATLVPTNADSIGPLLTTLERHAGQVASIIAIFQCWDDARRKAVHRLLARGIRPMVLVVEARGDSADVEDPAFTGILRRIAVPPTDSPVLAP